MASANRQEGVFVCPVCREPYTNPLKLPGCLHVFCEQCLITYITNFKTNDAETLDILCPVCRKTIELSSYGNDLDSWIRSLEETPNMSSDVHAETDNDNIGPICSLCKAKEEQTKADKFCVHCQETFCQTCSSLVHKLNVLKEHLVLDINLKSVEESCMFNSLLSRYFKCVRHPENIVSYICEEEDELCCSTCILEWHKHCKDVLPMINCASKEGNETQSKELKDKIKSLSLKLHTISEYEKRNIADNKEKLEVVMTEIQTMRTKLNKLFDALEDNLRANAKGVTKEFSLKVDIEEAMQKEKSNLLKSFSTVIDTIETLGSDSQILTVFHQLKKEVIRAEKVIDDVGSAHKYFDFNLQFGPPLQKLVEFGPNETEHIATIKENVTTISLPNFHTMSNLINQEAKKIKDQDILARNSPGENPTYSGILFCNNERLLLIDGYYKVCCLTGPDYRPIADWKTETKYGKPFCATKVGKSLIAISFPEQKKICFISEREDSELIRFVGCVKTRKTPVALFGLRNDRIAVSWKNPVAFGVLAFKSVTSCTEDIYFQNDTAGRSLKTFKYMAVDENRFSVIQPCTADKAVYCFDFVGNPKFVYTNKDLNKPRGVACDGDGNIYICNEPNSTIHVLTPDGVGHHVVRSGCPARPLAIAFKSDGKEFAVTNCTDIWKRVTFFKLN